MSTLLRNRGHAATGSKTGSSDKATTLGARKALGAVTSANVSKPSVTSGANASKTAYSVSSDHMQVSEYSDQIFLYMREMEIKTLPSATYIPTLHPTLTWPMRTTLVDWLTSLHTKLNLLPATLFLTTNLLDRFMSLKPSIAVEKFQLVGLVSLLLACKYEEVMVPAVRVLVHVVGGGYTSEEILKAERYMLSVFGFGIGYNSPCSFTKRTLRVSKDPDATRVGLLAAYFCDVSLLAEVFVGVPGSLVSAASVYLGKKVLESGDWTHEHATASGYTEPELLECAKALYATVSQMDPQAAVYQKYADARYSHVSVFVKDFTAKNVAT
ncbi:hypothetical protein HDU98_009391 [Podochytrium sp. JEL0797]|nr:hypothetical protein HDU98_009391 [Podochytrium sp. JEL0797]